MQPVESVEVGKTAGRAGLLEGEAAARRGVRGIAIRRYGGKAVHSAALNDQDEAAVAEPFREAQANGQPRRGDGGTREERSGAPICG